jgi:hypothetical protein
LGAALLATLAPAAGARAAEPSPAAFTGTWRHAGGRQEDEARRKAIEEATRDVPGFFRDKARRRLDERTAPPGTLTLRIEGERLALSRGGKTISLRLGGEPIALERDGERILLSARLDGNELVLLGKGDKGQSVTTYVLSPDGERLTSAVRMTGERLRGALRYRSTYRRK